MAKLFESKPAELEDIKNRALAEIESALDKSELDKSRVKYLGRKNGEITILLKSLPDLPLKERRESGPLVQRLKKEIEEAIDFKEKELLSAVDQETDDLTLPGRRIKVGHLHPLTRTEDEVKRIFSSLNFSVIEGPEIETEYYNFDALNIPENHPAREMWDTFWLKPTRNQRLAANNSRKLLRTHTSPVQVRYMETHQPPFQIIVPGRVFRYEATDASHEINFYQVEGLMVGKDVSLANFKFIIEEFLKKFFAGKKIEFRYRPSYFPFVEPGLEVDIRLTEDKKPASVKTTAGEAKRKGKWLELMGAGMVHPRVFEAAHYNPRDLQGFAFGLGLDRLAMIKYNIPDIRMFYSGDLRFIEQF
jgi:phenylalanyl-tRNA synthetase alpha chain